MKQDDNSEVKKARWTVPPSLIDTLNKFISLYNNLYKLPLKKQPLMIMGDPGVGKSLFLEVFEKLYLEDNPQKTVSRVNVAAIPTTLIESHIFGHLKGSFTGATYKRKGFVETSDLLILEEIGELPPDVQAKLLTFVEDGYYYLVGDSTKKTAKELQIIATTNKTKDAFRSDFFDRFFPFYVPPLYERRADILYYFSWQFPDILSTLKPIELMSMLAYNWPGNVREIEKVGNVLRWYKNEPSLSDPSLKEYHCLFKIPRGYTNLSPWNIKILNNKLQSAGINFSLLDQELKKYGLGLLWKDSTAPFAKFSFDQYKPDKKLKDRFNIDCYKIGKLDHVLQGLFLYCGLFKQSPFADRDLLILHPADYTFLMNWGSEKEHSNLTSAISDFVAAHTSQTKKGSNYPSLSPMTYREYLSDLMERTGGKQKKAAQLAGLEYQYFRRQLQKYHI